MALSMYSASIPVFVRGLGVLSALLVKAEEHAEQGGILPEVLLGARLAPDMLPLTAQVQRACDTAKLSAQRLSGVAAPGLEDGEVSFEQLQQRIAATLAYLHGVGAEQMADSGERVIALDFEAFQPKFTGVSYLLTFALPNFFFHIATAHGILRNSEVQVGKLDYLGHYD